MYVLCLMKLWFRHGLETEIGATYNVSYMTCSMFQQIRMLPCLYYVDTTLFTLFFVSTLRTKQKRLKSSRNPKPLPGCAVSASSGRPGGCCTVY